MHKVCEIQLALYQHLDAKVSEVLKQFKVSCSKGCSECCKQITTVMLPEGTLIAEVVLTWPTWRKWAGKLRKWCDQFAGPEVTRDSYFNAQVPCPFLNHNGEVCRIYEYRPSACRYLYAVSPKEMCSANNKTKLISYLNLHEIEAQSWKFAQDVQPDGTLAVAAPLPLMVLTCMGMLQPQNKVIFELLEGLPTPGEWMEKTIQNMDQFKGEFSPQESDPIIDAAVKAGVIPEDIYEDRHQRSSSFHLYDGPHRS